MRKVSELLTIALVEYRKSTDLFMCHIVNDLWNSTVSTGFNSDEERRTLDVIKVAINGEFTLNYYLFLTKQGYAEVAGNPNVWADRFAWRKPEAHAIRVDFWENLIAELKSKGE